MAEVTNEMIYALQQQTLEQLRGVRETLRIHTARFDAIDAQLRTLEVIVTIHGDRLDRIERRLELRDTEPAG